MIRTFFFSFVSYVCIYYILHTLGWSFTEIETWFILWCIMFPFIIILSYLESIYNNLKEIKEKLK